MGPTVYGPPAPPVLSPIPSLAEVVSAVNANADRVQSLVTQNATIRVLGAPGIPSLSGSIAMERPGRFRMQAGTALLGQEVDLGSNDALYWIWVRQARPPAMYTGRHDLYEQSAARSVMPVPPTWFQSALGLARFDGNARHDGPIRRPDGKLEIRSFQSTATGGTTTVSVLDASRAWVLEQHVYDATGQTLLASAVARSHRYYPVENVSLPQVVEIRLPPAQLALSIDVGDVTLNQLTGDPRQLWGLPQIDGYPVISLDPPPGVQSPTAPAIGAAPAR